MALERDIKDYFLKMIKSIGALARKIKYENRNGCPDWLVAYKGKLYLVELKSDKGGLTVIQGREINRYTVQDVEVSVLSTYDGVDHFIEDIDG